MGLKSKQEILASIPQVEVLLKTKPIQDLILEHSQQVVTVLYDWFWPKPEDKSYLKPWIGFLKILSSVIY